MSLALAAFSAGAPARAFGVMSLPDPLVLDSFNDVSRWTPGLRLNGSIVMDGRFSARWTEVASNPVVSTAHVPTDWTGYDCLGMWVWLRRPLEATVTVSIDSSDDATGRTGAYVRDLPLSFSGWKYHRLSRSVFGAMGDPAGWDRVRSLSLRFTGVDDASSPASVYLDRVVLTNDPFDADMTDGELIQAIDVELPGLEAVRAESEAANLPGAVDALVAYYRQRASPLYLASPTSDNPVSEAAPLMSNTFTFWGVTAALGDDIDWTTVPPGADGEWRSQLNRQRYFTTLGNAYTDTGDETYAAKLVGMMNHYGQENPAPNFLVGNNHAWRPFEAGRRMSASWLYLPGYLNHSAGFDTVSYSRFLKTAWGHGDYLYKFERVGWDNHRAVAANGLAQVAIDFPEFARASAWRYTAFNRLSDVIAGQVLPDGSQFEFTTAYHQLVLESLEEPMLLARANGIALPSSYSGGLEKMYVYNMYVVQPNRKLPSLNDSDAFGGGRRMDDILGKAAGLFGRSDMAWVATDGATGTPPAHVSHAFKYAGQYVMRSGWSRDAQYLVFDAGPYGRIHQHEDKLSFSLFSGGRNQLVDPGRYRYVRDRWRTYFAGSAGHNTILVDGEGQHRAGVAAYLKPPSRPLTNPWVSTGAFDYTAGVYNAGYGPRRDRSVTHRRSVFYVKPDYFIVSDLLEGSGRHSGSLLFHLAGTRSFVSARTKTAVSDETGLANIAIVPADARLVSVRRYTGDTGPVQGWVSSSYGEKSPATTVKYFRRGNLPFGFDTVLVPRSASGTPSAGAARLAVRALVKRPGWRRSHLRPVATSRAGALSIRWGSFRDHFMLVRRGNGRLDFGGNSTDARGALVRLGTDGRAVRVILMSGSRLTRNGRTLVWASSRLKYVVVDSSDPRTLQVSLHPSARLRLYAPEARSVWVNGLPRSFRRSGAYIRIP